MLICEDIPTRISGVYDDHGDGVVVRKMLNRVEIDLPIPLGKEVEVADLDAAESGPRLVERETGPREQDVGLRVGQDRHHDLDRLRASVGHVHIVPTHLVRKIPRQVLRNCPETHPHTKIKNKNSKSPT